MWMSTADGDLINLDHVVRITIHDIKDENGYGGPPTYWKTITAILTNDREVELWVSSNWTSGDGQGESEIKITRETFGKIMKKLTS